MNCRSRAARFSRSTRRIAFARSHAFPTLRRVTEMIVNRAAYRANGPEGSVNTTPSDAIITAVKRPDPRNDVIHNLGAYTRVILIWRLVNSKSSRNEQVPDEGTTAFGTK